MDLVESIQKLVETNKQLRATNEKLVAQLGEPLTVSHTKANDMIMQSRFRKMGIDYANINPIFKVGKTVLSGGLIVQTMIGEFWQSDVDIYTTDAKGVIDILCKLYPYWIEEPKVLGHSYNDHYKVSHDMYRGIYVKGVFVEIMQVIDPVAAISSTFDLDFCKCYFDGTNFHTLHPVALATKTHQGRIAITKERTYKYKMRGFTILQPLYTSEEMEAEKATVEQDESDKESLCQCSTCKFERS